MTLKLTEEKKQKIYDRTKLFEKLKPTMQFVAQVIDNLVASFPVAPLGPYLYFIER